MICNLSAAVKCHFIDKLSNVLHDQITLLGWLEEEYTYAPTTCLHLQFLEMTLLNLGVSAGTPFRVSTSAFYTKLWITLASSFDARATPDPHTVHSVECFCTTTTFPSPSTFGGTMAIPLAMRLVLKT
jgi:hypothetical protein